MQLKNGINDPLCFTSSLVYIIMYNKVLFLFVCFVCFLTFILVYRRIRSFVHSLSLEPAILDFLRWVFLSKVWLFIAKFGFFKQST